MSHKASPLAPTHAPKLPALAGVRLAIRECNIRYKGRPDVMLMELAAGSTIAGVLTRSLSPSAGWAAIRNVLRRRSASTPSPR